MADPRKISINDYTYELPFSRIAQYPIEIRDHSKLLINQDGCISEDKFFEIGKYIPENSLLIFNNTKVIQARMLFKKETGATIEVFCFEPYGDQADLAYIFNITSSCVWKCYVGNLKRWKTEILEKKVGSGENTICLHAEKAGQDGNTVVVNFSWTPEELTFGDIIDILGQVPLPPYINRESNLADKQRYQTIYAHLDGSVAAPTAGLHFTEEVMQKLEFKKIKKEYVTLHVGAGTFKPVSSPTLDGHTMHKEQIYLDFSTIEEILRNLKKDILCVGTTSVRTIESIYWHGVKLIKNSSDNIEFRISQWEPYYTDGSWISVADSLEAVLESLQSQDSKILKGETQLMIMPGYDYKIVNGIITNFHQPESTLLLLVAAFLGEKWKEVYQYALEHDFRFLSYGDCCLFTKTRKA
jgi:S-adenosylmethionine:tRNA ribosyltransferase-isomerase